MDNSKLIDLINQAPKGQLHIQAIDHGKPAIYLGNEPMLRYRDTPEGEAYAQLVVGAVNALPRLLVNPEHGDGNEVSCSSIEEQMHSKIAAVLNLNRAFQAQHAKMLTKLIFAAIKPLVMPGTVDPILSTPILGPAENNTFDARLEGVQDFCSYLLGHADTHDLPSEDTLINFATNWDKSQRSKNAAAAGTEGE